MVEVSEKKMVEEVNERNQWQNKVQFTLSTTVTSSSVVSALLLYWIDCIPLKSQDLGC
jgi:hypothetical protein